MKTYLKEIARGPKGARDLNTDDAESLMRALLTKSVGDLEIGAALVAMRLKGESVDELLGFNRALADHLYKIPSARPILVLPSYNGARKTALLTPLVAYLLMKSGVCVLVHGLHEEDRRFSSEAVFKALGWAIGQDQVSLSGALDQHRLMYVPLEVLSPALADLLNLRKRLGLRNSGHVMAKMIDVVDGPHLRVVNYTHPEYPVKLAEFFKRSQSSALLMRGHEGEPTCSLHRVPELLLCHHGKADVIASEALAEADSSWPVEVGQTLEWTEKIIEGRLPVPATVEAYVSALLAGLRVVS